MSFFHKEKSNNLTYGKCISEMLIYDESMLYAVIFVVGVFLLFHFTDESISFEN